MKAKMLSFGAAMLATLFVACGSGTGNSPVTDSVQKDHTMPSTQPDTSAGPDSTVHKVDTSALPK